MESLGTLGGGLVANIGMLVLIEVIDVKFTLGGYSCEYSGGVWRPLDVSNL